MIEKGHMAAQVGVERRRFHFVRCLGSGGFGEVYLATMQSAGGVHTEVAVKVLHEDLDPRSQAVQRLRDEGRMLGILNHPSILRVNDLCMLSGRVAMVTEYVPGWDLDQCITCEPPIGPRALLEVTGRIADALSAAYNAMSPDGRPLHLLHRDVKPANIRVGKHAEVKLLDFGIAKASNVEREAKTQEGSSMGSLFYMAPERFWGEGGSHKSDVFSLGSTLFEALTTERLFEELTMKQQFNLANSERRFDAFVQRRLATLTGKVPGRVLDLLEEMLGYLEEDRPEATELSRRCEAIADKLPGLSLRRWCHGQELPSEEAVEGTLQGETISEMTFAWTQTGSIAMGSKARDLLAERSEAAPIPADGPPAGPKQGSTRSRFNLGALLAVAAVVAASVGLVTLAVLGVVVAVDGGMWDSTSEPALTGEVTSTAQPTPVVAEVGEVAPVEAVAEAQEEPAAVEVAVAAPSSEPSPRHTAAAATTAPAPASTPVPDDLATVELTGATTAELRVGGDVLPVGQVPPGGYEVWVDFGDGLVLAAKVTLHASQTLSLRCSRLAQTCRQ